MASTITVGGSAAQYERGGIAELSIDRVVIQGAEFTRVAHRYLLQSEVEVAFAHSHNPSPHVERLTTLLEDIVSAADAVALRVVESQSSADRQETGGPDPARNTLLQVREGLREQINTIDHFMHRLDG